VSEAVGWKTALDHDNTVLGLEAKYSVTSFQLDAIFQPGGTGYSF
jgi:hypothetical protein